MYNDNCKQDGCSVKESVDSMTNVISQIYDIAMQARETAFSIHKILFGTLPSSEDVAKVDCAFDALKEIKSIEIDTMDVLGAVIRRIED